MIHALKASLRRRLALPRLVRDPVAEPLLAGYRRSWSPVVILSFFAVLMVGFFAYGFTFGAVAPARMMPFTIPVVLMSALVIWALPPGEYAPTRALEPIFVTFFAALILWPNYLAIALPSLPWLTLLRIIGVPLVMLFLVSLSVSARFRSTMKAILAADPMLVRLVVALAVLQTVSIALSSDPGATVNRWVVAQVNQTAIFFIACFVFTRRGFLDLWVKMFLAMLVILCLIGLWEWRNQAVPWVGHIPEYLKVDDESVKRILSHRARASTGIYRVHSTTTTSLGLAELLGLSMPFAMHFFLDRFPMYLRLAALAYIPFAVYLIFLTDSRLGVVTALCSAIFYLLIWALLRWRQERRSLFGPAIVLAYPAIFAAFVAATFLIGRLRAEVWGTGAQQASTESRLEQWRMGIPKIIRNPFGNGLGQGGPELGFYNGAGVLTIDSYYLSVLLELGVLGFVIYYGLMLRGVFVGARTVVGARGDEEFRLLLPLSVALMDFVISKSVFSQEANHPLIFMMLGAVMAMAYRSRVGAAAPPRIS
jgi:hypothetical protein